MFGVSCLLLWRPRHLPRCPTLFRRSGNFKCFGCGNKWESVGGVWVTAMQRCYQGQECPQCGSVVKPYYVKNIEETVFDRNISPFPMKPPRGEGKRVPNAYKYRRYTTHTHRKVGRR
jgi:hypothetical protein